MKRKIYLASSWRNTKQPLLVNQLREEGHEVYDFHNPAPGNFGFTWKEANAEYEAKNIDWYMADIFRNPVATRGYKFDIDALNWCDTCVLLLPCGKSAHLEAGYASGQGKDVIVYLDRSDFEPELMYRMTNGFVDNTTSLLRALRLEGGRVPLTCYG